MSEYTGAVVPGGPSAVRRLGAMTIRKASVGEHDNNAYLLSCHATGAQLLVDAAADIDRLCDLVAEGTGRLDVIVTTHHHGDHHRALAELVAATGARTVAGVEDAAALPVPVDGPVRHRDRVRFGDVTLDVVHLRGHTPGSIALVHRDLTHRDETHRDEGITAHVFSGDSLFPGGVGATFGDAKHFRSLIDDVEGRLFAELADDTWVYPGHGPDTTLGAERPHLTQWRARGW
jgi:glyoxylase-like metal-dependent hydrolase (beta-lactamase superfamily II)